MLVFLLLESAETVFRLICPKYQSRFEVRYQNRMNSANNLLAFIRRADIKNYPLVEYKVFSLKIKKKSDFYVRFSCYFVHSLFLGWHFLEILIILSFFILFYPFISINQSSKFSPFLSHTISFPFSSSACISSASSSSQPQVLWIRDLNWVS